MLTIGILLCKEKKLLQAKVKEWINEFEIGQAMPAQFSEALEKIQQPLVAKSVGLQKQQAMAAKSSIEEQPSLLENFFQKNY